MGVVNCSARNAASFTKLRPCTEGEMEATALVAMRGRTSVQHAERTTRPERAIGREIEQ